MADEGLSKFERLSLIRDNNLWGIDGWIKRIFKKQQEVFLASLKADGEKYASTIDDFINSSDYRNRGSTVDLVDELEILGEVDGDEIVVLTSRGSSHEFKMKIKDVEQAIYDWCCENKKIGYKFDW